MCFFAYLVIFGNCLTLCLLFFSQQLNLWQENFERLIFMHFVQEAQVEIRIQCFSEGLPEGVQVCHALCIVEGHQAPLVVHVHTDSGQWLLQ